MNIEGLPQRIAARLVYRDGHWIWTGAMMAGKYRYPNVWWQGTSQPTYRVVYTLLVGPIPHGLEIDHLCAIPQCCNPEHLEPVTHAENLRRVGERRSACRKRGHDWTNEQNIHHRPDGRRECAECHRINARRRYAERSAA